ncbi:MAG: hypothetical protein PVI21_00630 [Candidatus Woesebacteria bacterium]|jgi:hypothetical protein
MGFEAFALVLMLLITFVFRKQLIHEVKMQVLPSYANKVKARIDQELELSRRAEDERIANLVRAAMNVERYRLNQFLDREQRAFSKEFDNYHRQIMEAVRATIAKFANEQVPDLVKKLVQLSVESRDDTTVISTGDFAVFLRRMYEFRDKRAKQTEEESAKRKAFIDELLVWAKNNTGNGDAVRYLRDTLKSMDDELQELKGVYERYKEITESLHGDDFDSILLDARMADCRNAMEQIAKETKEIVQALSSCS